ncbi:MAG: hydrogenase, partial [Candidatus Omnitrophica bacterium]|nr:hydrogenase [Candidatus Omnitrophota bacterium]
LHFWLPGAHANAPSHVSAILSGVMLKMGVYGLVRTLSLFPDPPVAWGAILLVLGAASGLLGIWFAMANQDLKRLLAYSSVENVGILLMGLGLAVIGRALGREDLQVLGMGGCLLHVWNHALFKPLLFFGAGSVLHATHSRQLDVLGGLSRRMPLTAALFLIGALSISALPPLNGFVSELLIYLGLFRASEALDGGGWAGAALGAPILAMIGALAAACFVKVSGVAFLGAPRTPRAEAARESPWAMLAPMGILAACCLAVGVLPVGVAPFLEAATECWIGETLVANGEGTLGALAPLRDIGLLSGALAIGIASVSLLLLPRMKKVVGRQMTWDCGYSSPGPRMQYSASSFARILAKPLEWVSHPTSAFPRLVGLFPEKGPFKPQESRSFPEGGLQQYLTRLVEHGRLQLNLALFVLILGILLFLGRLDP